MTLPVNLNDREQQKFTEDSPGMVAVRVTGSNFSGSFSQRGLNNLGLVTETTINNVTWTALGDPLAGRNAIAIQNESGQEIKINYSNTVSGYVGMKIRDKSERQYDITDQILIYAKSISSSCTINIEEIS